MVRFPVLFLEPGERGKYLSNDLFRNGSGYADPTAYIAIGNYERNEKRMVRRYTGNKYGNKKIEVDGIVFDSKKEAKRYKELLLLEKAGEISELRRQVKYVLIPAQREPDTTGAMGGIRKGKIIEHECSYYADFVYFDRKKQDMVVEDTKGVRTAEYIIKRKLMLRIYGIRINEI